jgi:acetyltransferase-like isoleucine patch superfamily enzyme
MRKSINRMITIIKKEPFELDNSIPTTYLLFFLLMKFSSLLYGHLIFRKNLIYFIHPSVKIKCRTKIRFGTNLSVDRNCFIDALSAKGIKIGRNVSIGKYTTIECSGSLKNIGKGLIIGNNVGLGSHGFFGCAGGIEIGDDTIFGNFVSMHSENHISDNIEIPIRLQGVTRLGIKIGNNCWIGAKATILDGANIGDGCIVAAGAVVIKGEYKPNTIIGGVPAKVIRNRF